jgi:flavin-dependent dehydrogenase
LRLAIVAVAIDAALEQAMTHVEPATIDRRVRAIVIGAGPAGACAADVLARELGPGTTKLVERASWPRAKVCGCCLGAAGIDLLREHGLAADVILAGGSRLEGVDVRCGRQLAHVSHQGGVAIPRAHMDAALVDAAVSRGAMFQAETSARVLGPDGTGWRVLLTARGETSLCSCELLLVADGLGGSSLNQIEGMRVRVAKRAWMGVSTIVPADRVSADALGEPAWVRMHVGPGGYVGVVRLRGDSVAIAAALDPVACKATGGPRALMERIVTSTGVSSLTPTEDADLEARLLGSPLLTRRRDCIALPGLMVVGDSAGYVEPFTGEGMTWAIASGVRAAELGVNAVRQGNTRQVAEAWPREHAQLIRRRQMACHGSRWLIRRPTLASGILMSMARSRSAARIGAAVARSIGASYGPKAEPGGIRTGATS